MECNNPQNCKCLSRLVSALLIAAGLVAVGFFPGYYYYKTKMQSNFVTVKGLAEMSVKADLAVWKIKFVTTNNDLLAAQQEIARQKGAIVAFLQKKGLQAFEISEGRVETNDLMANPYRSNNDMTSRYILSQVITVRSVNVDTVEQALRDNGELVAAGIIFDLQSYGSPVSYIFTKLNEIKPQMLEEATKNAAEAAAEFAKSSKSRVGRIRTANQGVFSILPAEETPDAMQSQQINKKVRVVSTVQYWLE